MNFRILNRYLEHSIQAVSGMTVIFLLLAPAASQANPRQKPTNKGYAFTRNGVVISAGNGDLDALQSFIWAGMGIDPIDNDRDTVLLRADEAGQVKIVAYLPGLGANSKDGEFTSPTYITPLGSGNSQLEKLLYTHVMNRDFSLRRLNEADRITSE